MIWPVLEITSLNMVSNQILGNEKGQRTKTDGAGWGLKILSP